MKVVVIGGTGLIGSKLVTKRASVVIDVSNSPSFADDDVMEFFRTSTTNILKAEAEAGVTHHVALSVVGTERLQESGYFRAKQAQEELIKDSGIPYSIVHATRFFEFVKSIAAAATEGDTVRPAPVKIQPICSDDVAAAVGRTAVGTPVNGVVEVAGPDTFRLDELIRKGLAAKNDPRTVVTDPHAPYFGADLKEDTLVPGPDARIGGTRFSDWLAQQQG
ncbi:SDR family oxidoreductase [Streptomyces sp. NPDC005820]|uniref:SDR family oxidoreductase n=1 Tax=Streptomyces sp. NPDC005820 TaxID=3157069 RepID=UPI0033F8F4B0